MKTIERVEKRFQHSHSRGFFYLLSLNIVINKKKILDTVALVPKIPQTVDPQKLLRYGVLFVEFGSLNKQSLLKHSLGPQSNSYFFIIKT